MKIFYNIKNNKKGFTLIEMIVATVVLSIVLSATMGMMSSVGSLYNDTAKLGINKQIGDAVFTSVESALKYSTHLEIADTDYEGESKDGNCSNKSYAQGFYIEKDKKYSNTGKLMYDPKSTDPKVQKYSKDVYSEDFYQGRTISYSIEEFEYKYKENGVNKEKISDKHVKLTVNVYHNGKRVYTTTPKTIRCVNLGILNDKIQPGDDAANFFNNSNTLKFNSTSKQNQYLNFSCDEQLSINQVDGYDLYEHAQKTMAAYNVINNELCNNLNTLNQNGASESEKQIAVKQAREQISDLLGGYVPKTKDKPNSDPRHYFNGVEASKRELFYGILLEHYPDNGEVGFDSYKEFKDSEDFFRNTTFNGYSKSMVKLVNFYMNEGTNFAGSKYQPSEIKDFNIYSVKWQNHFCYKTTSGILWWKRTKDHTADLSNPEDSLGLVDKDGAYSFEKAYIVYHPMKATWYYMPSKSTSFSHWVHNISNKDDIPVLYDIKEKKSYEVMLDIDSNTVSKYTIHSIGFGKWEKKFEVDKSKSIVWNSLPAMELDQDT